jgi:hypothetical protein
MQHQDVHQDVHQYVHQEVGERNGQNKQNNAVDQWSFQVFDRDLNSAYLTLTYGVSSPPVEDPDPLLVGDRLFLSRVAL